MAPTNFDLEDLRNLRTPLVAYIGPELSHAAGFPSRRELAQLLAAALPLDTPPSRRRELAELAESGDLPDAFTELEREFSPARFGREVERHLRDEGREPPALASVLVHLAPRLQGVVTPNLDRLLERAFASQLVAHTRPNTDLLHRDGWLLKTNGTLLERGTWVLTREQHDRVRYGDPLWGQMLRALFIGKPMLFVATTPTDPVFDEVVTHVRALAGAAPPRHFALLRRAELSSTARTKLDAAGIAAIPYEDQDELLELLASLAPEPQRVPLPPRQPPRRPPSTGLRILFVSANPMDSERLALDRELRVIREAISRAAAREQIELEARTAACFADLSRALLGDRFDLVHIASHGEQMGIILDDTRSVSVPPEELAGLFDEYAAPDGRLRCVVLNACWSRDASGPIARVPTVIAMDGPVDDRAALAFAEGFYDAIGAGCDFAAAHREGQRRARCSVPGGAFEAQLLEPDRP